MYQDWMKEMPIIVNGEGKRNEDTYKSFKKATDKKEDFKCTMIGCNIFLLQKIQTKKK